jgi:hypothetical protein
MYGRNMVLIEGTSKGSSSRFDGMTVCWMNERASQTLWTMSHV